MMTFYSVRLQINPFWQPEEGEEGREENEEEGDRKLRKEEMIQHVVCAAVVDDIMLIL